MKKKIILLSLLVMAVLLTACGSASELSMYSADAAPQAAAGEVMMESADYDMGAVAYNDVYDAKADVLERGMAVDTAAGAPMAEAAYAEAPVDQSAGISDLASRKLIRNANLSVETEEFDALLAAVEEKVANLGGYLENYSTSKNSSYYGGNENRYASLMIRIPAVNYDQFVNEVSAISNVLNRNESVQDVTLQYVDLESHKKVLRAEQDQLLELLDAAENIEDVIAIESRLSEVRYQIESMESQLRVYDNLIDYSTIYLSIDEVKQLTPVQEQSTWEKISTGFVRSWKNLGAGLRDLFIWLIVVMPYLLMIGVVVVVILLLIKIITRKKKGKKIDNEYKQEPESKSQTESKSDSEL